MAPFTPTTSRERTGNASDLAFVDDVQYVISDCPIKERPGSCLKFTGSNYASSEDVNWTPESFTVELWVRADSENLPAWKSAFATGKGVISGSFQISSNGGGEYSMPFRDSHNVNSSLRIGKIKEDWQHIAITNDNGSFSTYLDGEVVEENRDINLQANFVKFFIGSNRMMDNTFIGQIDEVRVWESVQTAEQIQYNKGVRLVGNEPGLKAYWRLDEGSGTRAESITGWGSVDLINDVQWVTPGPIHPNDAYAVMFPSANGRAYSVCDAWSSDTYTVELWTAAGSSPLPKYTGAFSTDERNLDGAFQICADDNGNYAHLGSEWIEICKIKEEWQHVAVTYDGTTLTCYEDGEVVNQTTGDFGATFKIYMIGSNRNMDKQFTGKIDECRVWDVVRSADEIKAMKNTRLIGDEPGLKAYWRFGEPSLGQA